MADKQQPQEPAENRDDQQRNQQPQEPAEAQQPQQEPQAQEAQEITIDTSGYNPAADPGNPAFDMATWQAAVDKAGGLEKMIEGLKAKFEAPAERARAYMNLSLSQIEQLPQDERKLVWDELANQFAERLAAEPALLDGLTGIFRTSNAIIDKMNDPDFISGLGGLTKAIESAHDTFRAILPTLGAASENMSRIAEWALNPQPPIKWDLLQRIALDEPGDDQQPQDLKAGLIHGILDDDTVENPLELWDTLTPYIIAECDANPALYDDPTTPASTLITAAARRARADGKDIPTLKAEQGQAEQLEMEFPTENPTKEETRRKNIEAAHRRREIARQEGALDAAETQLAIIADKALGFDYFTNAVIKLLPKGIENFILDEQGRFNLYDLTGGNKDVREVLREADKLHTAFLMWLLGLAWNNSDIRETNSGNAIIPVYLPSVLESMKIDPRPRERDKQTKELKKRDTSKSLAELRRDKFMGFIRPLLNTAAFFGDDLYQVVGFHSYIAESETMNITTPYMFRLVEYAKLHATRFGAIKNIFHADIVTENQTAVEVADRIAMGVIIRGVTTADADTYRNAKKRKPIKKKTTSTAADGTKTVEELTFAPEQETTVSKSRTDENGITTTVTSPRARKKTYSFTPKFSTIIADCPQLQREIAEIKTAQGAEETKVLEAAKAAGKPATPAEIAAARRIDHKTDPQRVNKKLKDTFTAAIRIIMEKSEMPKYYKNLTFRTEPFEVFKAPTNSTLNAILNVSHEGKDPNFA